MKEIGQAYTAVIENDDLDAEITRLKRMARSATIQAVVLICLAVGTLIARLLT